MFVNTFPLSSSWFTVVITLLFFTLTRKAVLSTSISVSSSPLDSARRTPSSRRALGQGNAPLCHPLGRVLGKGDLPLLGCYSLQRFPEGNAAARLGPLALVVVLGQWRRTLGFPGGYPCCYRDSVEKFISPYF